MNTMTERLVTCPSCGTKNRLKPAQAGRKTVCGKCKTPLSESAGGPVEVTETTFSTEVEQSATPVLLDMWADWCGPCHMLAPTIDQLSSELTGRVKVAKLDIDANPGIANRFGVRSIPTLLVLKGGKEVDRLVGVQPKQEILRRLESVPSLFELASGPLSTQEFRPLFHERQLRSLRIGIRSRVGGGLRFVLIGRADRLPFDVNLIQRVQRDHQRVGVLRIPIEERNDCRVRLLVQAEM